MSNYKDGSLYVIMFFNPKFTVVKKRNKNVQSRGKKHFNNSFRSVKPVVKHSGSVVWEAHNLTICGIIKHTAFGNRFRF